MPRVFLTGYTDVNNSYPHTNDPVFASLIRPGTATVTVESFYVNFDSAAQVPIRACAFQIFGDIGQIDDGPQHVIATCYRDTTSAPGGNTGYHAGLQGTHTFKISPRIMFGQDCQFFVRYIGPGMDDRYPVSGITLVTPTITGWALGLRIEYDEE